MSLFTKGLINGMSKIVTVIVRFIAAPVTDPLSKETFFLGKPMHRVDGGDKVTGKARYTAEFKINSMAYASPVHSSIAKGTIKNIITAEAEKVEGVLGVMTYKNAPKMKAPSAAGLSSLLNPLAGSATTLPVMQSGKIYWNGQTVAVVIAETQQIADYAASLIRTSYSPELPLLSVQANKHQAFVPDHIVLKPSEVKVGNASRNFDKAAVKINETYTTAYQNHQAIEPHATFANWIDGQTLEIHDTTQYLSGVQEAIAEIFSLKKKNVRVLCDLIGGGFGGKVCMWENVPLAVAAAKFTKRPVLLTLPRTSVNFIVGGRSMTQQQISLGSDISGKLNSLIHTGFSMCTKDVFAEQFTMLSRHMYASETIHTLQKVVRLDRLQNTFMRAPGESPGSFALESAMDELAWKLKLDPVALRLKNEPDKDPTENLPFSSRFLREAFELGAREFGWNPAREEPRSQTKGDWFIGTGMAAAFYPLSMLPVTVTTRISGDGSVTVFTSSVEMGVGGTTIQIQHICDRFGVVPDKAKYVQGDTNLPTARSVGGSAGAFSIASAIQSSADNAIKTIYKLIQNDEKSVLYGIEIEDLKLNNGGVISKSFPSLQESFIEILTKNKLPFLEVEGKAGSALPVQKFAVASYGAHFCEVQVHQLTCEVKIARFVSAFDCGKIMNAATARSQIMGGIIMGIGMALHEETHYDDHTGRLMNPTLGEYHVPVNKDIPLIEVHFVNQPDPVLSVGAKGVGEAALPGVAAAVANAIYQATGKRVRSLPITLDKILMQP